MTIYIVGHQVKAKTWLKPDRGHTSVFSPISELPRHTALTYITCLSVYIFHQVKCCWDVRGRERLRGMGKKKQKKNKALQLQWKTWRRHNGDAAECKSKDDLNAARQHRRPAAAAAADIGHSAITFIYFFLSRQAQHSTRSVRGAVGLVGSPCRRLVCWSTLALSCISGRSHRHTDSADWFFRMETSVYK